MKAAIIAEDDAAIASIHNKDDKNILNDSVDSAEVLRNKNQSAKVAKNLTWMIIISLSYGIGLGIIDMAGANWDRYLQKEGKNANKEAMPSSLDILLVYQFTCFIVSLLFIICQNLSMWRNYGVFKHNEYYDLRTG